jgi:hypothetical protein
MCRPLAWFCIPLLLISSRTVQAQGDDVANLLARVPSSMNTLAIINVARINESERAKREKWRENNETEYLAGAINVPPWARVVIISADLNPGALAYAPTLALVPVSNTINVDDIAKRENGVVQSVAQRSIVLSPQRGYIGMPVTGILGVSNTMPRQVYTRWFTNAQTNKSTLTPYLQTASAKVAETDIVVAVDMLNMLDPTHVRIALIQAKASETDRGTDSLMRVISNIRGLTMSVKVGDTHDTEIRMDFDVTMSNFLTSMRKILPDVMYSSGFVIEELKTAEINADGRSLVIKTKLSDQSLRRILSLISTPGDAVGSSDGVTGMLRAPQQSAALAASLRYYRGVNRVIDDLRTRGASATTSSNYNRSALWFETAAGSIDKLPILDVNPELLQYGSAAANKMRAMAGSLRGTKMQLDAFESYKTVITATGGGMPIMPTRWGWVGGMEGGVAMDSNVSQMSTKQAQLVAQLEPERAKVWSILDSDRSAIRKRMLELYMVDFDQLRR